MLAIIRAMSIRHLFHRSRICSRTLLVLVMVCAVTIIPRVALPELRPIIRDMLENLGEIDDIGSGLAVDDFGRVGEAAQSLQSRASAMKVHGKAPPGLDNNKPRHGMHSSRPRKRLLSPCSRRPRRRTVMRSCGPLRRCF